MPATRKTGLRKRAQLSSEDSEPESLHSDALDDPPPKKRTRSSNSKYKSSSPSKPKPKPRKCKAKEDDAKDEEDVDGSDLDLKEGQQVVVKPGDESVIAAGAWCPAKNELATLRNHLLCSTPAAKTLRTILSSETFTTHFGPPHPHPHGEHQNRADKNHKDIALLKCRSLAVSCRFTDAQVIAPGAEFMDALRGVADVMMPFVHCLNDMMTLPVDDGSDGENEEDESDDVVE
ncbi:hypothetical protein F4604DRAFT_1928152 [Suillus subluteus]|nr:hypothetical protein F4604DRAFT_1928152 [Suillus subluteus]